MKSTFVQLTALVVALASLQSASAAPAEHSLAARKTCKSTEFSAYGKCHPKKSTGVACKHDFQCKSDHCSKSKKCAKHPRSSVSTTAPVSTTTTTTTSSSPSPSPNSAPINAGNQAAIDSYAATEAAQAQPADDQWEYISDKSATNPQNPGGPFLLGQGQISTLGSVFVGSLPNDKDVTYVDNAGVQQNAASNKPLNYVYQKASFGSPAVVTETLSTPAVAKRDASTKMLYFDYAVSYFYSTLYNTCVIAPLVNGKSVAPSIPISANGTRTSGQLQYNNKQVAIPLQAGQSINSISFETICGQNATAITHISNVFLQRNVPSSKPAFYNLADQAFTNNTAIPWSANNTADQTNGGQLVMNWPLASSTGPKKDDAVTQNFMVDYNVTQSQYSSYTAQGGPTQLYNLALGLNGNTPTVSYTGTTASGDKCYLVVTANGVKFATLTFTPGTTPSSSTWTPASAAIANTSDNPPATPAFNFDYYCSLVTGSTITASSLTIPGLTWAPANN